MASPSSSSSSSSLPAELQEALRYLQEEKKRHPAQLSLYPRRLDPEQGKWVDHPGKEHVEAVFHAGRKERVRVWEALGPYGASLKVLEVGGELFSYPTMDREELALLLPPRLDGLLVLYLGFMDKMDDAAVQALAEAGCGALLTSLTLLGLNITDAALQALAGAGCCARLESLYLGGLGITDAAFQELAVAGCGARLTSLRLVGLYGGAPGNFAQALGLPRKFFREKPQAVYRQWCKRNGIDVTSLRRGIASGDVASLRQWLENSERVRGPEHPQTLCSMLALATSESAQAAEQLERSVWGVVDDLVQRAKDKGVHCARQEVEALASSLDDVQLHEQAATAWKRCLGASREVLGEQHPKTLDALHGLGSALLQCGELAQSVDLLFQCLAHRRSVPGDAHRDTQATGRRLLAAHHRQDTLLSAGVPQLLDIKFPHLDVAECEGLSQDTVQEMCETLLVGADFLESVVLPQGLQLRSRFFPHYLQGASHADKLQFLISLADFRKPHFVRCYLVGREYSGKSTLCKNLCSVQSKEFSLWKFLFDRSVSIRARDRTSGVVTYITEPHFWGQRDLQLVLLDFGGHTIYNAGQEFFMSESNAMCIVVLSPLMPSSFKANGDVRSWAVPEGKDPYEVMGLELEHWLVMLRSRRQPRDPALHTLIVFGHGDHFDYDPDMLRRMLHDKLRVFAAGDTFRFHVDLEGRPWDTRGPWDPIVLNSTKTRNQDAKRLREYLAFTIAPTVQKEAKEVPLVLNAAQQAVDKLRTERLHSKHPEDAFVCTLEDVVEAFEKDPALRDRMRQNRSVVDLLLQYLFHMGLLLAVRDPVDPDRFFSRVVLDVNWLFRDVVGAFFDIPDKKTSLSQKVRKNEGLLREQEFLEDPDPMELGRDCSPQELQLAVLVFEEMQVCLRLEGKTLRVLERGKVAEDTQLFFPSLCPCPRAPQFPLDAVLEKLDKQPQQFLCSACRIVASASSYSAQASDTVADAASVSAPDAPAPWLAVPPNLFYRLALACRRLYCSGRGQQDNEFQMWDSAALVVNHGEDWALALALDHHTTDNRYHRGVTIVEWRRELPRGALLVPPRFPHRDAVLRLFQQEVWPQKYRRMEWEVVFLDTDEVRAGGRPALERKCTRFPKLAEGEGGPFLQQELEEKLVEQRRLRGLGEDFSQGEDQWPSAHLMATLALEGGFGLRMEEKVSRALSSDLTLLRTLHAQVMDPTHALFADSLRSVRLYEHLREPMRQWVDLMLGSSVGLVGVVVVELTAQSGRRDQELQGLAEQLHDKGEALRSALLGELSVPEELCEEIKDLVAKWETAVRTLSRGAVAAATGPSLADVWGTLGGRLNNLCEAVERLAGPSQRDVLQEVQQTRVTVLAAIADGGQGQREDADAIAMDLSTLLSQADALTRSLHRPEEEGPVDPGNVGVEAVQQELAELGLLVREILVRLRSV